MSVEIQFILLSMWFDTKPSFLYITMGKTVGQTKHFGLGITRKLGEGQLWFLFEGLLITMFHEEGPCITVTAVLHFCLWHHTWTIPLCIFLQVREIREHTVSAVHLISLSCILHGAAYNMKEKKLKKKTEFRIL